MAENGNAAGANTAPKIAGILALITILAASWGMVSHYLGPLEEKARGHAEETRTLRNELQQHESIVGHPAALSKQAAASEQFKGLETRLEGLRQLYDKAQERNEARLTKAETRLLTVEKGLVEARLAIVRLGVQVNYECEGDTP